jgi:LmbE family N-acetylglucosaminyl deacetylase
VIPPPLAAAAALVVAAALAWTAAFLYLNDFGLPTTSTRRYRRALAVFAHPDDETVTCGGLLHRLSREGCDVTLMLLTRGERGTRDAARLPGLSAVRVAEAQAAATALRIAELEQREFPDGGLHSQRPGIALCVQAAIENVRPDLIVTHDPSGLYGHHDHIACSDAVTAACPPQATLWYVTVSRRMLRHLRLDAPLAARRAPPTHRVATARDLPAKIRAWYAHRSQQAALRRGMGGLRPAWLLLSLLPFEYVAQAPASTLSNAAK